MNEIIEKIIVYVVGGIAGAALGFIVLSFNFSFFSSVERDSFVIITSLIGVVFAVTVLEHKKEKTYKENQKIWNEAAALITHEMRTSLTSTSWAIQITAQKYGDKMSFDDRKMLQGIMSSINTTVMHSVNLLDISLSDIGKLSISFERISLDRVSQMVKEIIEKFTIGANRSGIVMVSNVNLSKGRQMEVDLMRFRIILENLLENAIQYTLRDKKEIAVSVWNDEKMLNIIVKDTGIGIPEAEQSKIFSEFFRASNARKKLSSGSGIGLHMCAEYVRAHHGVIRFESKENEGTAFYVSLPLTTAADVNEFLAKI